MKDFPLVEEPAVCIVGALEGAELEEEHKKVLAKITRNVIPMVWVLTLFSLMSRINLSNMHVVLTRDLNLSEYQYGAALGAFYLAFVVFPVPANLILERMKMNVWIFLLVFIWGCISVLSIFIYDVSSLIAFRFCLGLAEAGISPGCCVETFRWYNGDDWLAVAISYSEIYSSTYFMTIRTYIISGVPTILLSLFFYFFLPNSPADARFLTPRDREILLLSRSLAAGVWSASNRTSHSLFWSTMCNSRNWLMSFCGMFIMACAVGINAFAPAIIYESGSDLFTSNLLIVIPHIIAVFAMLFWSYHSAYTGERFWHAFSALFVALLALGTCTVFVYLWDLNFVVGLLAVYQSLVVSGETVNSVLGSTSIGIGLYYAVVGFGGWFGPFVMGYARDLTGDHVVSLALMCASLALAISLFSIIHVTQRTTQIELGSQMTLQYESGASHTEGAKYEPKESGTVGGAAILV